MSTGGDSNVGDAGQNSGVGQSGRRRNPHPFLWVLAGAFLAGLIVSICVGDPSKLPSVALGSALLLHIERAVAFFAAALLLALVLNQAWDGNLPSEISGRGVKYEDLRRTSEELSNKTALGLAQLKEAVAGEQKKREALAGKLAAVEGSGAGVKSKK